MDVKLFKWTGYLQSLFKYLSMTGVYIPVNGIKNLKLLYNEELCRWGLSTTLHLSTL